MIDFGLKKIDEFTDLTLPAGYVIKVRVEGKDYWYYDSPQISILVSGSGNIALEINTTGYYSGHLKFTIPYEADTIAETTPEISSTTNSTSVSENKSGWTINPITGLYSLGGIGTVGMVVHKFTKNSKNAKGLDKLVP